MEQIRIVVVAIFLSCIYVTALSASTEGDIRHLMEILGKLKNIDRKRQSSEPTMWSRYKNISADRRLLLPSIAGNSQSKLVKEPRDSEATDMRKRQGSWTYDYGLGGGRFGKRNFGDYGIGGGRFGRDVDHVDLSD